ncbi:hypothetical protein Tco_1019827 [Tanacetum coccineum]|uniref:Uncharacterized protein n=1 Tax=Tanacetum coccineum TaxID=301880 RepID=A0ABQ5G0I9_9ASTR
MRNVTTFNFGDQFLHDKPTEDDQEKSKVREESDSTIPDPNQQTVTSTPPVIAPFTDVSSTKPSSLVTSPPINTEATTITTSLPEITPFIALQLRVARLEQEMSEVKKTDHQADVLASIKSQVPTTSLSDSRNQARVRRRLSSQRNKIGETDSTLLHRPLRERLDSDDDEYDDDNRRALKLDQTWYSHKMEETTIQICETLDNAHIQGVFDSTTTWFKPIPESERPATPEPEWTIPPNDFPEPENNWANTYATTYKAPEENKLQRKTYDIGSFIKWFCRRTGKKKLCKADLEGPAFNLVKAFHKNSVFLQYQMDECHKLLTNKVDLYNPEGHQIQRNVYEPLPLGGPPGQVTIQPQFFFNKDLDYLLKWTKMRELPFYISKLKAARYLDFGLEELVPSLWVESEREYDISAVYGITHWWFRRKEFYINKHSEPSDREAVRSQMRISQCDQFCPSSGLKVIKQRIKPFERPNWDAADYYFKEDYTIVPKPRAVVYRDRNDQRKLMRLKELHKFSDGTLTRVMEKLDHMVKDFICSISSTIRWGGGMETRKWSEDDKRRSKDFITAIEKRLQIRRIFRSLESFVGGRIRDIDYRLINRTTSKSENKGKVPTEMELGLEFTQQGSSHEVSVAVSSSLRLLEPKRTIESRAKRSSINLVRTQHPSETMVFHNEDGNPARANIKQALVYELTDNLKMEMEMEIPSTRNVK